MSNVSTCIWFSGGFEIDERILIQVFKSNQRMLYQPELFDQNIRIKQL